MRWLKSISVGAGAEGDSWATPDARPTLCYVPWICAWVGDLLIAHRLRKSIREPVVCPPW